MTDDANWDDLEDEFRDETERTDRAHESTDSFADVVARQYDRLDDGELNPTFSGYDEDAAVLLAALEESGELERVVTAVNDELGRETESGSKSEFLKAAARYAVAGVDEELLEGAREGHERTQNSPF